MGAHAGHRKGFGMRVLLPAIVLLAIAVPPVLGAPAPGPDPTDDPVHAAAWLSKHPSVDAVPDVNGPSLASVALKPSIFSVTRRR